MKTISFLVLAGIAALAVLPKAEAQRQKAPPKIHTTPTIPHSHIDTYKPPAEATVPYTGVERKREEEAQPGHHGHGPEKKLPHTNHPPPPPQEHKREKEKEELTMTWPFQNLSRHRPVDLKIYSRTFAGSWPGKGGSWILRDDREYIVHVRCYKGELLCFGAWSGTKAVWGVGPNNLLGCKGCCRWCTDGETSSTRLGN